jgi:hypothetical protein
VTECPCLDDREAPPRAARELNPTTHEILRQRWLARAAAALDGMRDPQIQDQLMTFGRREQWAVDLLRDPTVWLLTSHVPTDSGARPDQPRRIV